ncbi:MAG: hypothetical protein HQL16_08195 [Candidatus Omnitrophica bacterium]|nr:hypothetical protein [Candidatus Omnitrophota bacterium]
MQIVDNKNSKVSGQARRGQMSLILIFVVAAALILYAAAMNWNRVSQYKTMTTIAANAGAAVLVSNMASYGEQIMQTQLGGEMEHCAFTGLLVVFLIFLILVIFSPLFIYMGTLSGASMAAATFTTMVGIVAAGAAVVIQAAYIQPTITRLWNSLQSKIGTTADKYLESGLNSALQIAQTDTTVVPDLFDYDEDGKWYNPATGEGNARGENISRFAFHYTQRLLKIDSSTAVDFSPLKADVEAIWSLMGYDDKSTFCSKDSPNDPRCDKCCVPKESRPQGCPTDVMPPECNEQLTYDPLFGARLPPPVGTDPTLLYVVGIDDDDRATQRGIPDLATSDLVLDTSNRYRGGDSTGVLFPFLWLMSDSSVDLSKVNRLTATPNTPECMWCSVGGDGGAPCAPNSGLYWAEKPQLYLPLPACVLDDCCAGKLWRGAVGSYLNTDKVVGIDDPSLLAMTSTRQVNSLIYPQGIRLIDPPTDIGCPASNIQTTGIWRKGSERGCFNALGTCAEFAGMACMSTVTAADKASSAPVACGCSQSPRKDLWSDDLMDDAVYRMRFIYDGFKAFHNVSNTAAQALHGTASQWADTFRTTLDDVDVLADELSLIKERVDLWRNQKGLVDETAYCLPPEGGRQYSRMTQDERDYIKKSTDPWAWDSITSVYRCLEYHLKDYDKYGACAAAIDADPMSSAPTPGYDRTNACQNLPRSLVNDFDANNDPWNNPTNPVITEYYYKYWINMSRDIARNMGIKFQKRAEYLKDLVAKANTISSVIADIPSTLKQDTAKTRADLTAFLNATANNHPIDNRLIYGWQSPPDSDGTPGRWHMVMAEGNSTSRCTLGGDRLAGCVDEFPKVKTKTKFLGFVRCYYMDDYTGRVRMRVVRYDEDRLPQMLKFLNNIPLWDFVYRRPGTSAGKINPSLDNCVRQADKNAQIVTDRIGGSFIIVDTQDYAGRASPTGCQIAVNTALQKAIASETCADYTIRQVNGADHFDMNFVKCP